MYQRLENLSIGGLTVALTASLFGFLYLSTEGIRDFLENQITLASNFMVRETMNLTPKLDGKVKVFSNDDITVQKLKVSDYSLSTWAMILEKIAASKPKAIIIDKVFDEIRSATPEQKSSFINRIKSIGVPIIVGSSLIDGDSVSKERGSEVEGLRPEYSFINMCTNENCNWLLPQEGVKHFGPSPELIDAFQYVGLINKGTINSTTLLASLDNPRRLVGHSSVYPFNLQLNEDLVIEGHRTYIQNDGSVLYNLIDENSFWTKNKKLLVVFEAIFEKKSLEGVTEGDIVIVLPEMYTGNTDFKNTYLGEIPGGLLLTTLVNSALTGNWIWRMNIQTLYFIYSLITALFFFAALKLKTKHFLISAISAFTLILIGSILLFCLFDIYIPSVTMVMYGLVGSIPIGLIKFRQLEKNSYKIHAALDGAVSEEEINSLLRNPNQLELSPKNQNLTIVFIDMVGFSLTAESRPPDEVFAQLKEIYQSIRELVHKYGGYVDRSLGDGLLCFFGFNYGQKDHHLIKPHVSALNCAQDLQRYILKRNIQAFDQGKPIFPLRIGVNTDIVCTGDLGDERSLDFTVIGNGVNFASRLESACEHYCVLVGEKTRALLTDEEAERFSFIEKFIKIKHHANLIKAYEYNPLSSLKEREVLNEIVSSKSDIAKRKDERQHIDKDCDIVILTDQGNGKLLNFSRSGFAFDLDKYIAKGAMLEITLDSSDHTLGKRANLDSIFPIFAEVRWAHIASKERIIHGVSFVNLSDKQREWLFNSLIEFMHEKRDRIGA